MKLPKTRRLTVALLIAVLPSCLYAQEQAAPVAPKISPEIKQRYAVAAATAAKDPQYLSAVEAATKAQRAADRLFFEKMRQLDGGLKEYLDYLEKTRFAETKGPSQQPRPQSGGR